MSDQVFRQYFQALEQQIATLKREQLAGNWEEITAALENLQLIYEQMQTNLEAAEVVEERLLQQNQRIAAAYQHYQDLFLSLPLAYLITDANGVILEGNQASAQLLKVPQLYIAGKPLAVYVAKSDRATFYTKLNELSEVNDIQIWRMNLCPRKGKPFPAELNVAIARNHSGEIETIRIAVSDISRYQQTIAQPARQVTQTQIKTPISTLPQSLDGLQVLIIDDETDAREFIGAVLESYGIRVTAVATAAAALETLSTFHPDVLVCDIRMPGTDGYNLIRQIRALEAQQGRHIPAAALTAYLDENREKALAAGFEAYLHKLAQPDDLIEMVVQLAEGGREI
ncbi:response regulator [Aerosakkonema funiforme]|uniref:Response regulator n=1 Tax=Aerosakkonema funiforme FACHB-1375 TaxID=2949571 RepID=A0A926ZJ31_9CYAN|nr:response regulator [Aerosakkonema funiforme]MBD2182451.1 response regulator [Aerosakkonema funiforme FACHB-1375]